LEALYNWKLGKKHGEWKEYNQNQILVKIELYENDKLISSKKFK
jgi:antitoxin component YwqK of YwqJK toxin-antitoxin module